MGRTAISRCGDPGDREIPGAFDVMLLKRESGPRPGDIVATPAGSALMLMVVSRSRENSWPVGTFDDAWRVVDVSVVAVHSDGRLIVIDQLLDRKAAPARVWHALGWELFSLGRG
jgi:hypothetical protein